MYVCLLFLTRAPTAIALNDEFDVRFKVTVPKNRGSILDEQKAKMAQYRHIEEFRVRIHPQWAPLAAARFKELVKAKFFDGAAFFRVVPGFMAQFGIAKDPGMSRYWAEKKLKDDPIVPGISNTRGRISFAHGGKDTRTAQCFINFGDNSRLDREVFVPFGEVLDEPSHRRSSKHGMEVVDLIYSGYGDEPPGGKGPKQGKLWQAGGYDYLASDFPKMSYIMRAEIVPSSETTAAIAAAAAAATAVPTLPANRKPVLVECHTTKGQVDIEVHKEWAPLGAARFLAMVKDGYYNGVAFYRYVPGFLTQFGIAGGDLKKYNKWKDKGTFEDDPKVLQKFPLGGMSFAGFGANSRTTQTFIALSDNTGLGRSPWETPFALVSESGMEVIKKVYNGYADMAPFNTKGIDYGRYEREGNTYLKAFPHVDFINSCTVARGDDAAHPMGEGLHTDYHLPENMDPDDPRYASLHPHELAEKKRQEAMRDAQEKEEEEEERKRSEIDELKEKLAKLKSQHAVESENASSDVNEESTVVAEVQASTITDTADEEEPFLTRMMLTNGPMLLVCVAVLVGLCMMRKRRRNKNPYRPQSPKFLRI